MKKKIFLFTFLFSLILAVNVWALGFELAGGVWGEKLSGDLSYKGDTLSVDDLNYDREYKPCGRLKVDLPLINFYFAYTPVHFEGKGEKNVNFKFGDYTFNATVPFDSSLTMDQYDIGVYWGIPFLKMVTKTATLGFSGLNIEFGLNVRAMKIGATIKQNNIEKTTDNIWVYLPMLYGGISVDFFSLTIDGEIRGIGYNGNHYYDFIGRVKWFIFKSPVVGPSVFISGGYRYQDLSVDQDDFKASLKLSGPFVEMGVDF